LHSVINPYIKTGGKAWRKRLINDSVYYASTTLIISKISFPPPMENKKKKTKDGLPVFRHKVETKDKRFLAGLGFSVDSRLNTGALRLCL